MTLNYFLDIQYLLRYNENIYIPGILYNASSLIDIVN